MKKNRITGILLFIVSAAFLIASRLIKVSPLSDALGSRFWPTVASIGLMICSLGIFFSKSSGGKKEISAEQVKRGLIYFAVLILYMVALYFLGFAIASALFAFISVTLMSTEETKSPVWKRILFSIVLIAFIWIMFEKVFYIRLPQGKLF